MGYRFVAVVSVCIPTFNYARFLPDAIGSVLSQTFDDFELLVVDNCSTDGTGGLVEDFARREPRLRYYKNASNLGLGANFNRAMELANGEYVKILCADDWLAPRALEKSVAALVRHPEAAMVTTARLLVSEARRPLGVERYCGDACVVSGRAAIKRCLFGANHIGEPSAVTFRRALASRGFDEQYSQLLDLEMWFRLLEQGALVCVPEPLAMIRRHGAQITRTNAEAGRIVADRKRLFAFYGVKPYVKKNRWNVFVWRLRTAYSLWRATRGPAATGGRNALGEFVPPLLFYCLLPVMVALETARNMAGRWRAVRARSLD